MGENFGPKNPSLGLWGFFPPGSHPGRGVAGRGKNRSFGVTGHVLVVGAGGAKTKGSGGKQKKRYSGGAQTPGKWSGPPLPSAFGETRPALGRAGKMGGGGKAAPWEIRRPRFKLTQDEGPPGENPGMIPLVFWEHGPPFPFPREACPLFPRV